MPPELIIETVEPSVNANFELKLAEEELALNNVASELPDVFELRPNYPNPFNIETNIEYALPEDSQVRILIYNVRGQVVRHLVDAFESAGIRTARWNGRNDLGHQVGSGMYFVGLQIGDMRFIRKMSLQK